ncbi:MAG: cyanophycinase [Candidatus Binatia bacterium]
MTPFQRHLNAAATMIAIIAAFCLNGPPPVAGASSPEFIGPANGSLVLVGGDMNDRAILKKFVDLAGGSKGNIVLIPTAQRLDMLATDEDWKQLVFFLQSGVARVTILHTRDRAEADSETFVAPLLDATGVWLTGGRQWRLARAYLDTRTQRAIDGVLHRGGVVGGSSAGAVIQGSYLTRGSTKSNQLVMSPEYETGFGLLHDIAIDTHVTSRNRQNDLTRVIKTRAELLGIGIADDTAIVVKGNRFNVIGSGQVAIFNPARLDPPRKFTPQFLKNGDVYDLKERRLEARATPSPSEKQVPQKD